MTLRIVHVSCVIDAMRRCPQDLLGAWPTLPAVAAAVAATGAEVTVVQASRTDAEFRQDDVLYRFVAEPRVAPGHGPGLAPRRLAAAAASCQPDIIHFHGLDFPCHARALGRAEIPFVVQDHSSRPDARIAGLRRWGYQGAAGALFTSAAQAEPFRRARQLSPDIPIFSVPESSTRFEPDDRDEARRAAGIHGQPAVLWVGHLDANKDPLTVLHAVRTLLPEFPDLHLWCAFQSAPLLDQIQSLLHADPLLAEHVHLLGAVEHGRIEILCRASDLFALASRRESTGYAVLEALACGLPPVVSDIPSFRALTGDGAVGALAASGDSAAFAAGIAGLARASPTELRRGMRAHFERHLSFGAMGRKLVDAYEAVLQRARVG